MITNLFLGQYLVEQIQTHGNVYKLQLGFVWNRTKSQLLKSKIDSLLILDHLEQFVNYDVDIIVEAAHPSITKKFGHKFIQHCDYLVKMTFLIVEITNHFLNQIGSPSALADSETEHLLKSNSKKFGIFIPSGALWGANDIRKMADRGTLHVTISLI